jgi:hypothetical protein
MLRGVGWVSQPAQEMGQESHNASVSGRTYKSVVQGILHKRSASAKCHIEHANYVRRALLKTKLRKNSSAISYCLLWSYDKEAKKYLT